MWNWIGLFWAESQFRIYHGRSQDFSKGGHTGSNNIVMAFLPRNIVGCLLKKRLPKGGHGHPRTPLSLCPCIWGWGAYGKGKLPSELYGFLKTFEKLLVKFCSEHFEA